MKMNLYEVRYSINLISEEHSSLKSRHKRQNLMILVQAGKCFFLKLAFIRWGDDGFDLLMIKYDENECIRS